MSAALKTMSFNIRCDTFCTSKDNDDYWPAREPLVTKMLQENQPHILGVQELMSHQINSVLTGLPSRYQIIGSPRDNSVNSEQCAILYDPRVIHPLNFGTFCLSDTPLVKGSITWGNKDPRIVTWAHFFHKQTQHIFTVANTHFDHKSELSRQLSAQMLLKYFDNTSTILMGDFNTPNESSVTYSILTDKFKDALVGNCETPLYGTWNNYRAPVENESRIDWILVSKDLIVEKAKINNYTFNGRYPSDHLPIEATLILE